MAALSVDARTEGWKPRMDGWFGTGEPSCDIESIMCCAEGTSRRKDANVKLPAGCHFAKGIEVLKVIEKNQELVAWYGKDGRSIIERPTTSTQNTQSAHEKEKVAARSQQSCHAPIYVATRRSTRITKKPDRLDI